MAVPMVSNLYRYEVSLLALLLTASQMLLQNSSRSLIPWQKVVKEYARLMLGNKAEAHTFDVYVFADMAKMDFEHG